MPDPILGFGTTLQVDRGAGYVTIVKNVEIGAFGAEAEDVDVTTHSSTGGFREFIRGLLDGGTLDFTGIWVADATQIALMDDLLAGTDSADAPTLPYRIVVPDG